VGRSWFRAALINIGESVQKVQFLWTAGFVALFSVVLFTHVVSVTHLSLASYMWLMLGFLVATLFLAVIIQTGALALGRLLAWAGNYYPNWYYWPKFRIDCEVAPDNGIVVLISNPRNQSFTLRAVYAHMHEGTSLGQLASGIMPEETRELLPAEPMRGQPPRRVRIGRFEDGVLALRTRGAEGQKMRVSEPRKYGYVINFDGIFKGREYFVSETIPIEIASNHDIRVRSPA
jgi:hypothetical protein